MKHYWTGEKGSKFCPHCGTKSTKVRCYTGSYSTKTGTLNIETLIVCYGSCYFSAPKDLMLVESKYTPTSSAGKGGRA